MREQPVRGCCAVVGDVLFGGLMLSLKREHQDVDKAAKGFECGMIAEVKACDVKDIEQVDGILTAQGNETRLEPMLLRDPNFSTFLDFALEEVAGLYSAL